MKKYLALLCLIALPFTVAFAECDTHDAIILGGIENEVAGGLKTMRYQMVRVKKMILNNTNTTIKDTVIVAK